MKKNGLTHNNHEVPLSDHLAFDRRLDSRRKVIKTFQAQVNRNRSLSEKIADILTFRLGSMIFLIVNLFWFVSWIVLNLHLVPSITPYDPFPFGLLTMVVSLEAIFLSIIVLISQNRESRINDMRDEIALQVATIAEEEITKMMELQILILEKHGIDVSKDEELLQMLEPTDQKKIERALERQLEE